MKSKRNSIRTILAGLLGLSLLLWAVQSHSGHIPTVIQTLQDHAEMAAEHGHSHGLQEDLIWAYHGHTHDAADHDHSQVFILAQANWTHDAPPQDVWALNRGPVHPVSPPSIDRPPRV